MLPVQTNKTFSAAPHFSPIRADGFLAAAAHGRLRMSYLDLLLQAVPADSSYARNCRAPVNGRYAR